VAENERNIREKGFTLFEILITLSIMSVILSILYMTFHQSMAVMAEMEDRAEVIQQGRLVVEKIAGELKETILIPQKGGSQAFRSGLIGQSTKEGKDFMDRLSLTTLLDSLPSSGEGSLGFRELGYYLDRQPGGKGFTLFRRQDEAMDGNLLQGGTPLALCDGVRSLGFSYFDKLGQKVKDWNSLEGERRNSLPTRIEVHLRLEDSRGRVHDFLTQVFLPMSG
jgi:prepilin-type N-terminal cleavage/methylation domain-containing protein